MAITNRRHIRKILNDLETINRKDVLKYTKGHLSVARNKGRTAADDYRNAGAEQQETKVVVNEDHGVIPLSLLPLSSGFEPEISGKHPLIDNKKSLSTEARDFRGVSKAEQLQIFAAKTQNALKEKQAKAKLQLKRIEQQLNQELGHCKSMEGSQKEVQIQRFESGMSAFEKTIDHSAVFGDLLSVIKGEFDSYALHLIDRDDHRSEIIQHQLESIANSRDLERLRALESTVENVTQELRVVTSDAAGLSEKIERKQKEYEAILPPVMNPSASKCRPPLKLSQAEQVHELRTKISEKEKQINNKFSVLKSDNIPKGQYKITYQTYRDLQSEVNSLSAGCRMLDQKVQHLNEELESLLQRVEMSEKDARVLNEVINGTDDESFKADDPFELIGKIELGEISLIDWDRLQQQINSEPWSSYIS